MTKQKQLTDKEFHAKLIDKAIKKFQTIPELREDKAYKDALKAHSQWKINKRELMYQGVQRLYDIAPNAQEILTEIRDSIMNEEKPNVKPSKPKHSKLFTIAEGKEI